MKYLGIDVHLKSTEICELGEKGEVLRRDRVPTTATGYRRYFGRRKPRKIVMESGPSTPWVYRLLTELGHEVLVLDPRKIRLIAESTLKCDRTDAEILARLCRMDEALLQPVYQRRYISQELRTRLKARQSLVRARAKLMTTVRGCLRAHGYRMRSCTAKGFVVAWAETPVLAGLRDALDPLIETISGLTDQILALEQSLYAEAKDDELLERLQSPTSSGATARHTGLSCRRWSTTRAGTRTTGPNSRISQHDNGSDRCAGSRWPVRPNDSSQLTGSSRTCSGLGGTS